MSFFGGGLVPFHSIGVFFFNHDKDGTRQWALTHTGLFRHLCYCVNKKAKTV